MDRDLLMRMAAEVEALHDAPMVIALPASHALAVVGLIQLALRHPNYRAPTREAGDVRSVARACIEAACEYFQDCPATLEVIRLGGGDDDGVRH